MQIPDKNGPTDNLVVGSTVKTVYCILCAEVATVHTNDGQPLCGIPGNHPDYDNEATQPLS